MRDPSAPHQPVRSVPVQHSLHCLVVAARQEADRVAKAGPGRGFHAAQGRSLAGVARDAAMAAP